MDNLPPYNQHLTTDTGGLFLGFALLLGWAVRRPELIVPVCSAFALSQALHLAFHLRNLDTYSTVDAVTQTVGLTGLVIAPLIAIATRPTYTET